LSLYRTGSFVMPSGMKAILRTIAAGLVLATIAAGPPEAGRFLLLDTRQLLEGEIERTGDGYVVRRDGGETLIPAARVVAVCADRMGAFRILTDKTDARSADQRLKLAEWCHNNGLPKEAIAEAKAAVELRPTHVIAQRFLRFYEQAASQPTLPAAVERRAAAEPEPVPDTIDCSPEALAHFCTKAQPVLMNACANCHAGAAKFRLLRAYSNSAGSRPASFQNLATVLAQIDREKPASSPLLQKALAAHGGSTIPPLRDRGSPAFQQLETLVRLVAGDSSATPIPKAPEPKSTGDNKSGFADIRPEEKPSGPKDPFDPAEFNKKNHPDKP
jgi:hypothetical protein